MGKYEPLARYLKERPRDQWDASFDKIEEILGFDLPPSARRHRSWWGNSYRGNHSQAEGWIGAGWEARDIDLRSGKVRFERSKRAGRREIGADLQDLWLNAREVSGISNYEELERAALRALIDREVARALIAMGGSDPTARAAPRERPFG